MTRSELISRRRLYLNTRDSTMISANQMPGVIIGVGGQSVSSSISAHHANGNNSRPIKRPPVRRPGNRRRVRHLPIPICAGNRGGIKSRAARLGAATGSSVSAKRGSAFRIYINGKTKNGGEIALAHRQEMVRSALAASDGISPGEIFCGGRQHVDGVRRPQKASLMKMS